MNPEVQPSLSPCRFNSNMAYRKTKSIISHQPNGMFLVKFNCHSTESYKDKRQMTHAFKNSLVFWELNWL